MSIRKATLVERRQHRDIHRTVRRVKGYWYRAGVPRKVRRQKSEELRVHLFEAVADSRSIEDVVGVDLAAFAAEWAEAERSRPLLDLALQMMASVTLLPGGFALLNPFWNSLLGEADPRIGLPAATLSFLAVIVPVLFAWNLLRVRRHLLSTQQTAIVGVALAVGYGVLLALAQAWWSNDEFVIVEPATAWTLVIVGAISQGMASWLKRSRWR